jgi:hypothetical protein
MPSSLHPTDASYTSSPAAIQQAPQSTDSSLSTGAKIGIAVGAVAIVLLILAVALLLFCLRRRKRKNQNQPPPAVTAVATHMHEVEGQGIAYSAKEEPLKQPLGAVIPTPTINYDKPYTVPELEHDPRTDTGVPSNWSPGPRLVAADLSPQQSPFSAYSELTAVVPSEINTETQTHHSPTYGRPPPPRHSAEVAEADSEAVMGSIHAQAPSPMVIGEMQDPSSTTAAGVYNVYELSSTPYLIPATQELASSPCRLASAPPLPASTAVPQEATERGIDGHNNDSEERADPVLDRMKREVESIRAEKERLQKLGGLEARECELSREIVSRELRASGTGARN